MTSHWVFYCFFRGRGRWEKHIYLCYRGGGGFCFIGFKKICFNKWGGPLNFWKNVCPGKRGVDFSLFILAMLN